MRATFRAHLTLLIISGEAVRHVTSGEYVTAPKEPKLIPFSSTESENKVTT
jgi:hypothetical protein